MIIKPLQYFNKVVLTTSIFITTYVSTLSAQQSPEIYKVTSASEASVTIPFKARYQFDQFKNGTVYLFNNKKSQARMNYSFLYHDVFFIGPQKDTLSIAESSQVRFLSIGENIYYHNKTGGYAEMIADFDGVKLGKKQGLVTIGNDKYVGYGQYIGTSATASYESFLNPAGHLTKLDRKTSTLLTHRELFIFIDRNNSFFPASKSSLLKIYAKSRSEVLSYLKVNQVDFSIEGDLKKVMGFCSSLTEAGQ